MKNFDKIDAYLKSKLSPEERSAFEDEIRNDEDLALEVAIQRFEESTIASMAKDDLKSRIQSMREASPPDDPSSGRGVFPLWVWLLGVAITIGVVLIWLSPMDSPAAQETPPAIETPSNTEVTSPPVAVTPDQEQQQDQEVSVPEQQSDEAETDRRPPPLLAMATGKIADADYAQDRSQEEAASGAAAAAFLRVKNFYNNRQYEAAILEAENIPAASASRMRVLELTGLSQLRSGQLQAAITTFSRIIESEIEPYAERSDWHLLLSQLAESPRDNTAFTKQLDKLLSDEFHSFHQQALDLQKELTARGLSGN